MKHRNNKPRHVELSTSTETDSDVDPNEPSNGDDSGEVDVITDDIIFPGLILNDDYVLLKKIGYGNNAGVWMTYSITMKSYFAMKIQDHECYDDGCREIKILKNINLYIEKNKNINTYCVNMLDCFKYSETKDDGVVFVCSVYELYAGSVDKLITSGIYKYGLPIPVVKRITKQLLTSLDMLHTKLNVIHADIKPENILIKGTPPGHMKIIDTFEGCMFQQKYDKLIEKYGKDINVFNEKRNVLAMVCVAHLESISDPFLCEPATLSEEDEDSGSCIEGSEDEFSEDGSYSSASSENSDDIPKLNTRRQSICDLVEHLDCRYMVSLEKIYDHESILNNKNESKDTNIIINDKYVNNCQIAITDFGNSYFYDRRTKDEIQDRLYRAPEVILDFNYGYACDIWSVGCVVFELLTGFPLFEPNLEPLTKDIHHLYLMEKMLGPLPLSMKRKSKRSKFLFNSKKNYHIKNIEPFKQITLKTRLINQFLFTKSDATACSEFILSLLKYSPATRGTPKSILEHSWLANV